MQKPAQPSRRDFLFNLVATGGVIVSGGLIMSACGKSEKKTAAPAKKEAPKKAALKCDDTTGLKPAEIQMRTINKYVEKTATAGQNCANCNLYNAPAAAGSCGGCKILKGKIHPEGWCKLWVKKA